MGQAIMVVFIYTMATIGVVFVLLCLLMLILAYWYDFRIVIGKDKGNGKTQAPKL